MPVLMQFYRCCIDKTNSAELSEAINSMYRWYKQAKVCYVYLADVTDDPIIEQWKNQPENWRERRDPPPNDSPFVKSRWFTRGWTLQELLGPERLRFFSSTFKFLGTKRELCELLVVITGISDAAIRNVSHASPNVAQKMSWAARRQTTRVEDMAYCLLGLFDVNIPLIYGEGEKAFRRLQEEIMKNSNDQTLFAWNAGVPLGDCELADLKKLPRLGWPESEELIKDLPRGIFAKSPLDFAHCKDIVPSIPPERQSQFDGRDYSIPPIIFNNGLRIGLPVLTNLDQNGKLTGLRLAEKSVIIGGIVIAVLTCRRKSVKSHLLGIPLRSNGYAFTRFGPLLSVPLDQYPYKDLTKKRKVLHLQL